MSSLDTQGRFTGKAKLHNISQDDWERLQPKYDEIIHDKKNLTNNLKHSSKEADPFFLGNKHGIYYYRYKNNNWKDIYNRRALSPEEQIKLIRGGNIKLRVISYHGAIDCDIVPKTFDVPNNVFVVNQVASGEAYHFPKSGLGNNNILKAYAQILKQLNINTKSFYDEDLVEGHTPMMIRRKKIIDEFRKLYMDIYPKYFSIEDENDKRMGMILFPQEYSKLSIPQRYDELYKKHQKSWDEALMNQRIYFSDESDDDEKMMQTYFPNSVDDDFLVGKTKTWEKYLDMPCDDKPMCIDRKHYKKKGRSNFSYNRPVCCPESKSVCRKSKNPHSTVNEKRCYWDYDKNITEMVDMKISRDDQIQQYKLKPGIHNPDKPLALQTFDIDVDNSKSQLYRLKKMKDQNDVNIIGGVYVLNENYKLINLPLFTFHPAVFGEEIDLQTLIHLDQMVHRTNKDDIFIYVIESCRNMDQPYYLSKPYKQRVKETIEDLSDDEDSKGNPLNLSQYKKKPRKKQGGKKTKKRRKKRTKKKARKKKKTRRKRN